MKLGLHVTNFTWPDAPASIGPRLTEIAQIADRTGFESFSVMDHFFQIPIFGTTKETASEPMLESASALAYLAGQTERIRLRAMVNGVTYRHPGLLIKAVTTLDVLSGGRAIFGIGAAWNEQEHLGLGVPYPPLKERFERLEETLQIAHQMWAGDASPYAGVHYQLAQPINSPNSIQRPRPPILIGGGGEKKTLRFVAQYGDACNLFDFGGIETVQQKLDVLRQHCADLGRPYGEIEKTVTTSLRLSEHGAEGTETIEQAVERFQLLADIGIEHVMFSLPSDWDPATFARYAEQLVPAVTAIQVAGDEALTRR
jgi:F420-dependent oxidoreductase-like protein